MAARASGRTWPVLHYMGHWLPLSEQFVYNLVTGSRHRGIVVSRHRPEHKATFPFRPVLSLRRIPSRSFAGMSERRMLTLALMAIAKTTRAGLIHVHHGYNVHDVLGVVPRTRLGLVVTFHGEDIIVERHEPRKNIYGPAVELADAVIVPSQFLAEFARDAGADPATVHVIPSGVDLDWFTPAALPPGPPEVLFVGRFVEKKGVDVLLRSWATVAKLVPEARLRLLGHGIPDRIPARAPNVIVELTDPGRRALQVRDRIRAARVVVTPSRTAPDGDAESLLLVNLEAQASGRPLVTTRHGGIPEFVAEDETALLVPEGDADALADALLRILQDHGLAERMAAYGPVWVRRFDMRVCTARVDDLYDRIERRPL